MTPKQPWLSEGITSGAQQTGTVEALEFIKPQLLEQMNIPILNREMENQSMESVPKEWLTVKAEIKEKLAQKPIEKKSKKLRVISLDNPPVISVEEADSMFGEFMQEGDEIWHYSSPPESWQMLCGRSGYTLVREGEVIDSFLTLMN